MTQYRGRTVDEAVSLGLKTIQISRDKVIIEVLEEPVYGWFGRLKQAAVVDIAIKPQQIVNEAQTTATHSGASVGAAPKAVHNGSRPTTAAAHEVNQRTAAKRDEEITRTTDAAADVRRREGDAPHATSHLDAAVKSDNGLSPEELHARQLANQQKLTENLEKLADYLLNALEDMGIDADAEAETYHHGATITFMTEQEGLLIGRHGRTINALQLLGNTFMLRQGMQHFDLMLDVGGYRERRATTLRRLADTTARDAIANGQPILLDPMPAFERKVIHSHLATNNHVQTSSQGREPRRGVVVTPR